MKKIKSEQVASLCQIIKIKNISLFSNNELKWMSLMKEYRTDVSNEILQFKLAES